MSLVSSSPDDWMLRGFGKYSGFFRVELPCLTRQYAPRHQLRWQLAMNQQVIIPLVDQIQNAERRYYVVLHQYSRAVNSSPPEVVEGLKKELCDAFAELKEAHDKLALDCE
jgi:hypothetical protein